MAFDPISIGASLLGGLFGSKNKAPTQTDKKEPWAPAQPYLLDNLETNKQLQSHYQQNPFNAQQKQGYQNLFTDADNFRGNVAPGLMDFSNRMMNSNYQRKTAERPGGVAGYGLLNQPAQAQQGQQSGLLAPFSVAQTTPHGQIDWNASNPFFKTPEQIAAAQAAAEAERQRLLAQQQPQQSESDWWQQNMTGLGA